MRNNRKIDKYIERIGQIHAGGSGDLSVADATRMLAIIKCLEAALTAFLFKRKL